MNRAESRRCVKNGKINPHELKLIIETETERLRAEMKEKMLADISEIVDCYTAVLLNQLHDKLGFGPVRAQRFANDVMELFDNVRMGLVSIEDIKAADEEDLGIKVD